MVENLNWSENLVEKGYVEGRGKVREGDVQIIIVIFLY